ncbi:MAG: AraC family transcriptional regulator [Verrucomicrobia bacterium]|nr:AraC family transcriptional regulator [Verrucomicrobiota bacterium]MCH8514298.1 AraC family transcriptional regulator [Kiritimatiellia bacterium]
MAPQEPHPQLLWIARFDYRGGLRVVEHEHPFHQCLLALDGEAEALLDGERFTLKAHDFLWIVPGVRHGWTVPPESYLKTLDMKFSIPNQGIPEGMPPPNGIHASRPDLESPFRAVYACARSTQKLRETRCALMLHAFLLQAAHASDAVDGTEWEGTGVQADAPGVVQSLEQAFSAAPERKWTAAEVASSLHLSYRRISQLCREEKRQTPMRILREVRIRKAKELLCYGDVEVKEVADLMGFESVHHFSRCFREIVGLPPAAWRERVRATLPAGVELAPGFQNRLRIEEM